jgi:ribosomal protein L16 Arg81 hydroxylase
VADLILLEPDKFLADYFKKRPTKNKNSMTDVEARIKADNNTLIKLREDLDMYIDARTLADR